MYAVNKSQLFSESQSAVVEERDVLRTSLNNNNLVKKLTSDFQEAMSRRKQNKPRHLDADEEIGQEKLDCSKIAEKTMENKPEINSETPNPESDTPANIDPKDIQTHTDPVDIQALYRQEAQKYFAKQGLTPPNHVLMNRSHMEPQRAIISPLPRNQEETSASQPLRAAGPRYFQTIACPDTRPNVQYSDDDDVPSDVDSCANESELQEELDKSQGHHHAMSPLNYTAGQTQGTDNGSEGHRQSEDEEVDEDNTEDKDLAGSSNGTVKLKALETTNVAVAQVVENDNPETDGNLPNLQQVLFTLHQQQMFQLQVLQQIQHQVTKLAHTDDEPGSNGVIKPNPAAAAAAAMFGMSWLNQGLANSLHQQRTDESGVMDDDISEASGMSNDSPDDQEIHEDDQECPDDDPRHLPSDKRPGDLDRELSDDMLLTPSGSPDLSPRSTPAKTPSSMGDKIGDDPEDTFHHHTSPRHMPPLPYLGGLGHFMPGGGNPNPLLPSNMFNPHSMQMPMPGRFPIFRTPVLPKPDEEDPLEEFMEIDTSDSNKLEEFMKKVEPTLKDPNQCAICKKVLSCKSALQMHYRTHTGSRPFKCKICGRAFTTKGNLKTHMSVHRARHAGPPLHQCPVCGKKFNSILHAQEHMRLHLGEMHHQHAMPKPPVMPVLPQAFMPGIGGYPILPPALPQERRIINNNNDCLNLSNSSSSQKDSSSSSIEQKSPIHNDISQVKRPPVDSVEELRQKRQKIESNIEHKPENAYIISPPTPQQKDDLDKSSSHDINPYSASLQALEESVKEMDKKMTSSSNFFIKTEISPPYINGGDNKCNSDLSPRHLDNNKDGKKESVQTSVITQAPQQPAKTGGSPVLPSSQPVTSTHSPPSCPTSPFSSGRRQSLRHVCNVCHKPFSSSSALQIHMRTHTGERPFKCNVCEKAFTTKGNLKVHMSTHAIVTGPPRRGRRMSMDNLPAFSAPGQFPPVAPRPPMHMFPGFPYPSVMNNMFLPPGKGLPFLPTMGLPGMPLLSPRRDDVSDKRESSASPTEVKDYHKTEATKENNNIPSKGLHGELDLSTRSQAIKT